MLAHTFNSALGRQRAEDLLEFEANLVYKVSSRTARATQRNPVSKKSKIIIIGGTTRQEIEVGK